jgi:cytochrome P450
VAQEVVRVDPPVPSTYRVALVDTVIQGVRVPAGTKLELKLNGGIRAAGNGSKDIDPEQWIASDGHCRANTDLTAFGSGPRRCPGQTLAVTEMVVIVALFARHFSGFEMKAEDLSKPPTIGAGASIKVYPRAQA